MAESKRLFKTAYTGHTKEIIPSGDGIETIWEYRVDDYGRKVLTKVGKKDLYQEIQASLEETKIENVLARAMAGENVFRPEGIYADLTEMPNNLIEARQAIQNLENTWNKLPTEIKNKYNNSIEDYINASGSESWLKDMGLLPVETKEMNEGEKAPAQAAPLGQVTEGGNVNE